MASTRVRQEDGWRLEPEGETEMPETKVFWNGMEGHLGYPDGEGRHDRVCTTTSAEQIGDIQEETVETVTLVQRERVPVLMLAASWNRRAAGESC